MKAQKRLGVGVAVAAALALGLAGCTGKTADEPTSGATDSKGGSGRTYVMITHQKPGDAFWDVVKKGAEQAGADLGVKVEYQPSGGDAAKQASLIQAAVDRKVDGIIVSMASPKGIESAVKAALAAKIPVVTINGGSKTSKDWGALAAIGQEEKIAGNGAGEAFAKAGSKNILCVIHEASDTLRERCDGAQDKLGGKVTILNVDGANPAKAQSDIQAKLTADKSFDGVLTLNSDIGVAAMDAAAAAGSSAKIATFDVNPKVIEAIKGGKMLFAVDQQQYLQGYLPIVALERFKFNGNTIGGGLPILTGPGIVDKSNADEVEKGVKAGTR